MAREVTVTDQAIDPELRPIIEAQRLRALARPALTAVTPPEMRVRAAAEFAPWNEAPEPVAEVRDLVAGKIPARLYRPHDEGSSGLLVYLHGGGWVIGDLDLEDAALRRLTQRSRVPILSIEYRLAPEHPYPAALEDAVAAFEWAAGSAEMLGIDARRIALGGASAGANLALGAALRLRDGGQVAASFLLLMYGSYAGGAETESYRAFADGRFGLPRAAMDWFWRTYAGPDLLAAAVDAVPLKANLVGLPPTFLNYAELDILRDDSVHLADRLRGAGVDVVAREYAGAVHGFTQYSKASALARRALDDAGDALEAALG